MAVLPPAPDDGSSPDVVLVLEYVEGPPLLRVAADGSCTPMPEPLARRAFADVFQVRRSECPKPYTLSLAADRAPAAPLDGEPSVPERVHEALYDYWNL